MIIGTSQNFQSEVLGFKGKVLVDFWASWCGPCLMLGPIIDEIGEEMKDKLKIVKVDADTESGLSSQFNITSIPAVIIFDDGVIKDTIIGFHQKQDYLKALML
jgi:thioredoxin 1